MPETVESFLAELEHPHKDDILALRKIILDADLGIREGIKWKVLSFHTTDHFATLNLRAKKGVGFIMHFGAKKNDISANGITIPDPASLLEWLAKDRAMITFTDAKEIAAKKAAFIKLIREWIQHV